MKYGFLQKGMWIMFQNSYARALESVFHIPNGKHFMKACRKDYEHILSKIDAFDKDSRFKSNITSCAMVIAVLLNLSQRPSLEELTAFYHQAMCENQGMKLFIRLSDSYSEKG